MSKRAVTPEDLLKFIFVGDPQISPEGNQVLYTHKSVSEKNKYVTKIWVVSQDGVASPTIALDANQSNPRWLTSGEFLFLRSKENELTQIWRSGPDFNNPTQISRFPEGSFGEIRVSPTGKWCLVSFRPTQVGFRNEDKKVREDSGASVPPRITEKAWYRLDGDGYFMEQRYQLCLLNLDTGEHQVVDDQSTDGSYSADWAPDESGFYYTRNDAQNLFRDPIDVHVYHQAIGGTAQRIHLPDGSKSCLRISPDGNYLAYLGGLNPHDHRGVENTKVMAAKVDGSDFRCLTDRFDYNFDTSNNNDTGDYGVDFLEWSKDNRRLYSKLGLHGEAQVASIDLTNGNVELLTEGQHVLSISSLSKERNCVAAVITDPTHIGEICQIDLNSPAPEPIKLTSHNDDLFSEIEWSVPEEYWVPSTDDVKTHCWVLKPTTFDPKKRYPGILEVHGGPQMQYGWGFFHEFQLLAAAGYIVYYSNPRGSKGYGEEWVKAIAGSWGVKDWEDIHAVKDFMKSHPFVDPARIAIMGGSYGGYIVNWAVCHTQDFKAAITDRCVSNLISKAGNSDYPYFNGTYWQDQFWGDHAKVKDLWRDSPIAHFDKANTPMLIIHSEGDLRCNIEQSEQVFTALQERGILSRFVRYPSNTSHGMSRNGPPDLRIHRLKEILTWWERTL